MVTLELEGGKMKCHRYWPDPSSCPPIKRGQYGAIDVAYVDSTVHKNFIVRTFDVS